VAGPRPQEPAAALDDGGQELLEGLGAGERLAELGQMLELADAAPRLLVEARVLDRAGDERGARGEDLHLGLGELPRRLRVQGDGADHLAALAHDRNREERLEALLLQLRDELVARIGDGVLRERGLLALDRPPGEPFAALERDLADEVRVRLRRRAQHEPLALVLDEVDEARVHGARLREEAHDGAQNLLELQRRADGGDDLVEDPALAGMRRTRGDGRIVRRNSLETVVASATCAAERGYRAPDGR
jgi:hypothetical protein